jgi:hypothetical protein
MSDSDHHHKNFMAGKDGWLGNPLNRDYSLGQFARNQELQRQQAYENFQHQTGNTVGAPSSPFDRKAFCWAIGWVAAAIVAFYTYGQSRTDYPTIVGHSVVALGGGAVAAYILTSIWFWRAVVVIAVSSGIFYYFHTH